LVWFSLFGSLATSYYFNIINFSVYYKGIKSFITFSVLPSAVVLFAWALKPV
jgi:hypothetical protein